MKTFAAVCVLFCWTLVELGICIQLPEECLDCRLVRMACTDELRNERCSCNSREVCCNNCCGGQSCVPKKSGPLCPDGSKPVNCFMSPCQSASCVAYPEATCVDNYCGGCNTDWFVNGEKVDCNDELPEECLDCRLVRMACTDELRNNRCSCSSREVCCNNCCGGQSCVPKKSGSSCPDGSKPVNCLKSPCQSASCVAYPEATCVDNYCGGCSTDWYIDGKLVDCNGCPDGSHPVYCFVRPCQFATCEAYPDATCVDNYCGGCNADWFVGGKLVDCNVCKLPIVGGPCKGCFRRWGYRNGRCRRFIYGGCQGNGNRFLTKRECLAACKQAGK